MNVNIKIYCIFKVCMFVENLMKWTGGKIMGLCINSSFIEHPKNTSKKSVREINLNIKSNKNSAIFFSNYIFTVETLKTFNN